ncbi:MAG: type II toxin-antitoxin system VapC family toxin [Thermomicrobiales bacterium]
MDGPGEVAVSAVQVAEFISGLASSKRPIRQSFLESLRFWEINQWAAQQAGIYRYDFARRGVALSTPDTLIAAVAREYEAILVTNNAKDFPLPDVELIVLRPENLA